MLLKTVTIIEYRWIWNWGYVEQSWKCEEENLCSHNTLLLSCYESLDSYGIKVKNAVLAEQRRFTKVVW